MIWKDVEGFEGFYQVNEDGDVKSLHTYLGMKPHLKKPYLGKRGYMVTDLSKKQFRKNLKVHRIVAKAFIPNPLNLPQVNHIDGNKLNNKVSNLEWVTSKQNVEHAIRNGLTKPYNHLLSARKLTPDIAIEIYNAKGVHREIAKRYNVGNSTVAHIKTGTRWQKYTNHHR